MEDPQTKWNRHWKERAGSVQEPDGWLLRALPLLPPTGRGLDVACGGGRNTLFLAERGWKMTAVDLSEEGLTLLAEDALRRKVEVETLRMDLEEAPALPAGPFDLALLFFYLQRSLFPSLLSAVRPGGIAVVRTFSEAGDFPGGLENPDFVLRRGELPRIFAGWEILLHEEGREPARRGGGLAGIIARKNTA